MAKIKAIYAGSIVQGLMPRNSTNYEELITFNKQDGIVVGAPVTISGAPVKVRTINSNRSRTFAVPAEGEMVALTYHTEAKSDLGILSLLLLFNI